VSPVDDGSPLCTYLAWDSEFFGRRIARLNRNQLDEQSLDEIQTWCSAQAIDCVYFLADSNDVQTIRIAERNDFFQTDVRMTFEKALTTNQEISVAEGVRFACTKDLDVLRIIARSGHRDTRFYFDEHFERAKCDLFYETWIENSFRGFAKAVLVAEEKGKPVGYVTCHLPAPQEAQIGILGVADQWQGLGVGTKLVQHFLNWSVQQGARRATVVTQARNVRAQRLYQRNGFVTSLSQLWYHRWFVD